MEDTPKVRPRSISPFRREQLEEFPDEVVFDEVAELSSVLEEAPELGGPELHALREQLMAELRLEAEQQIAQAVKEGRRDGFTAAKREFETTVAQAVTVLEQAAAEIVRARAEFLESLEPQVVKLSLAIARCIIQREASMDRELIQRAVRRALDKVTDRQHLRVTVHPDDLAALRAYRITLLEDFEGVDELDIEASENVSPGGCIVESERVRVDATPESLLETLSELMTE